VDIHTHNYTEQDVPPHWAIRLAELSELYGPHKDQMGGPIDALEITSQGINWIQCESSCQCSDGPQKIPEADSRPLVPFGNLGTGTWGQTGRF
jgi:hypothetical protein